ncbi:MAG: hypothetical protein QM767_27455 [Anaeromyxobacter sp.]
MADRSPPAASAPAELVLGPVTVSFQRYARPEEGFVGRTPPSHGALPVAAAGGDHLVAVPEDEAFWLGLVARSPRQPALVRVAAVVGGARLDALAGAGEAEPGPEAAGVQVPGTVAVNGVARAAGGAWCFTRVARAPGAPACTALILEVVPGPEREAAPSRGPEPLRAPPRGAPTGAPTGAAAPPGSAADAPEGGWQLDRRVELRVELVAPEDFAARAGLPPPAPLRDQAAYRGWRLP